MRRRSKTNSHHETDKAAHDAYTQGRYYDELLRYFPSNGVGMAMVPGHCPATLSMHGTDAFCDHHIFGGIMGNRRWDRLWNLVMVCDVTHRFVDPSFGGYVVDGVAICMRRKIDAREFDRIDAANTLGFDPFGYLESRVCVWLFAENIRRELVRQSAAGEIGCD